MKLLFALTTAVLSYTYTSASATADTGVPGMPAVLDMYTYTYTPGAGRWAPAAGVEEASAFPIWPTGPAPGDEGGVTGPESFVTENSSLGSNRLFTNVTNVTLTPHVVAGATSAVVVAPGGAYTVLSFDAEGEVIAAWFNSIGVSAFVLKYRVPDRAWLDFGAAPLMDAQRALSTVRSMALSGELAGLDPKKIGFIGFSAGGHLSGHVTVAPRAYARVDAIDDTPFLPDFSLMIYPWRSVSQPPVSEPNATADSVTAAHPPTFLSQAEDDGVHMENAFYYYLALKNAKAPASELHIFPEGGHGYGMCTLDKVHPTVTTKLTDASACTWPRNAQLFLQKRNFAPPTTTNY